MGIAATIRTEEDTKEIIAGDLVASVNAQGDIATVLLVLNGEYCNEDFFQGVVLFDTNGRMPGIWRDDWVKDRFNHFKGDITLTQ